MFTAPYDRTIDLIKRVIGVPGARVQVIDGVVWRNGERIADPHAYLSRSEVNDRLFRRVTIFRREIRVSPNTIRDRW